MIGNDIIDLKAASEQSNWRRRAYMEKIFTKSEQAYILNSTDPFKSLCLCWSMKESAYKIVIQQGHKPFYAPKALICKMGDLNEGFVFFKSNKYFISSNITPEFIYTIAKTKKDLQYVSNHVKIAYPNYKHQSKQVHQGLKQRFSQHCGLPVKTLEMMKSKWGVPIFYNETHKVNSSLSITHHGNFGAYAFSC